jgi:hypothetical protein
MNFLFEVVNWVDGELKHLDYIEVQAPEIWDASKKADEEGYAKHGNEVTIMRVFSKRIV